MTKAQQTTGKLPDSSARDLLKFYDDFAALNACNAFVLQALAAALLKGNGLDERSATGAMFCAQWLSDQTVELERRLKKMQQRAHGAARS